MPRTNSNRNLKTDFSKSAFNIEHALIMYANSFCTLPAEGIYDREALASFMDVIETCHIYVIGFVPKIKLIDVRAKEESFDITFDVLNKERVLTYNLARGSSLKHDGEYFFIEDAGGKRSWPSDLDMQTRLSLEYKAIDFEVKYVGQAYGDDGSRNAIDRLLKHETLQKIALKGVPEGYRIGLLLFAVQPNTQLLTWINPFAVDHSSSDARINQGLDKLFNTTEIERISLYEAALIRYFYPEFNKEFKDSFPSTNLKILRECYKKDFAGVVAEINFDEFPCRLWSKVVPPAWTHIAKFDLHKKATRKMFLGMAPRPQR